MLDKAMIQNEYNIFVEAPIISHSVKVFPGLVQPSTYNPLGADSAVQ